MIDEIKKAVHDAAGSDQKIAMFHFQVLTHADELGGMDPESFCKEIAVPVSYATEFRKMLGLARLLKEQGAKARVTCFVDGTRGDGRKPGAACRASGKMPLNEATSRGSEAFWGGLMSCDAPGYQAGVA